MTQLTTTAKNPVSTLLTLAPEQYVAEVFNPFRAELALLKAEAEGVTYDITTTAGMKVATEHRAKFRQVRVDAEKARKERKAPILEIGKLLDSRYKELEAEITPLESRFDSDIKAEEVRKEAERQAKIKAEQERVTAIRAKIDKMKSMALSVAGMDSASIQLVINGIPDITIDESFAEFKDEAYAARSDALNKLEAARDAAAEHEAAAAKLKAEQEAEAARIQAEREELARMRAENESRRAELERQQQEVARQQAVLEAAQRKREADAAAALVAEEAEHRRMVEIERAEEADRAMAAHAAGIAQDVAPCVAEALAEEPVRQVLNPAAAWPAPVAPPTLRIGHITERLGFIVTASLLSELGFEPSGKERAAVLYYEHQFPVICAELIKRIDSARRAHLMAEAA